MVMNGSCCFMSSNMPTTRGITKAEEEEQHADADDAS